MAEDDDRRRPRRLSLKTPSPFNNRSNWKDKLRENCYKRVQENRASLLWKLRLTKSGEEDVDDKEYIKSTFADIVADEFKRIKDSTMDENSLTLTSVPETDDSIWGYDGLHTAAHQGECEDILLEMQRIFYEDLREEPSLVEEAMSVKTWDDEEDEYLARAVFEHMQLNDKQEHKVIWCPICKTGELQEKFFLITCTLCDFKLNRSNEITLDLLKDRLAEAHAEHFERGCTLKPKFCVETRFGLTALYLDCRGCDTFEVVI